MGDNFARSITHGETDAIIKFSLKSSKARFILYQEYAVASKNNDLVSCFNLGQFPQPVFHLLQSKA
jgi:hypothetical protein